MFLRCSILGSNESAVDSCRGRYRLGVFSAMFAGDPRPFTKIYLPLESRPGDECARIMTGLPGSSASDRDRMCERGNGWRLGVERGGSGVSESVIMTFPERSGSGSPLLTAPGESERLDRELVLELDEASDSTEFTGLGSMRPPGRVRDASMVTHTHSRTHSHFHFSLFTLAFHSRFSLSFVLLLTLASHVSLLASRFLLSAFAFSFSCCSVRKRT